jgi:NADH:ubiquinone reductase (H+-translocating)
MIPHVVIVGGGFGGLYAARALRRAPVRVTVIDRRNYHLFQPLLYQVAAATLSPADIARPIRQILAKQGNASVLLAEVVGIDAEARSVVLADERRIGYDYLIVASGAVDQYFGHDEWAPIAPALKTIDDATEIRRRFLLSFEAAEQESDPELRRALLTFVVIGGGPTGVEMAGSFAEIAHHTLLQEFRSIDPAAARIVLVEGGKRLLAAYPEELSARAKRDLEELGVEVRLGSIVTRIDIGAVYIGEERIPAYDVVWAAGVAASPLGKTIGAPVDKMGRVAVEPDLSVPGHREIFAIGDLAAITHDSADGKPLPGVAQVAMQGGAAVARNIAGELRGEPRRPFHYRDKGNMATIGRARAVAEIRGMRLTGFVAWLTWLFIHVLFLIGFRNRVVVLLEWAWSYLTWQRGARLITGGVRPDTVASELTLRRRVGDGTEAGPAQSEPPSTTAAPEPEGGGGWMEGDPAQGAARTR